MYFCVSWSWHRVLLSFLWQKHLFVLMSSIIRNAADKKAVCCYSAALPFANLWVLGGKCHLPMALIFICCPHFQCFLLLDLPFCHPERCSSYLLISPSVALSMFCDSESSYDYHFFCLLHATSTSPPRHSSPFHLRRCVLNTLHTHHTLLASALKVFH